MKNLIITISLLFTACIVYSQDTESLDEKNPVSDNYIENDLHSIRQIKGSDDNIRQFFEASSIDFKQDTLYVILVPPMVCSRCEGIIKPFIYSIKKIDKKAEVVILAFYPRRNALEKYLNDRDFKADHTIASSDESFLDNFVFSSDKMQAPYITKMTINGDMLIGKSTLGMDMDEKFVNWIHSYDHAITKVNNDSVSENTISKAPDLMIKSLDEITLTPIKEITIGETTEFPISKCLYPSLNTDLTYFAFMDELSFNIYVYKIAQTTAYFYTSIKPDNKTERMYIHESINDSLYYILKSMNIVNTMFFGNFFHKDTLIVTASLPNIFFQDEDQESLAYFNQVSYLYYIISTRKLIKNISPELSATSLLIPEHTQTSIVNNGKYFFIPVTKGWPVSGHEALSEVEIIDNPFQRNFYDNCPIYSVYDNKGKFITYLGRLCPSFINNRLGYSYSSPIVSYNNGIYWITDSYSGSIEGYSDIYNPQLSKKIEIFKNEIGEITPDEENALEYLKSFDKIFQTKLIDFEVVSDTIICILKQGEYYVYKAYTTDGTILQESFLPNEYGINNIESYTISIIDNKLMITGVFSSTDEYKLVLFIPNS